MRDDFSYGQNQGRAVILSWILIGRAEPRMKTSIPGIMQEMAALWVPSQPPGEWQWSGGIGDSWGRRRMFG